MLKTKTQVILFVKNNNQWELKKIENSEDNWENIERYMNECKEATLNSQLEEGQIRVEDFKIWGEEDNDTPKYWDDINFYNPANFIYLPIENLDNRNWAWFNMEEGIPEPNYDCESIIKENFNFDKDILLSLNNSDISKIKEFINNIKQNEHANCTVNAFSTPVTLLAWNHWDMYIRFQVWGYKPEKLFDCENGMDLILDIVLNNKTFFKEFDKKLKWTKISKKLLNFWQSITTCKRRFK